MSQLFKKVLHNIGQSNRWCLLAWNEQGFLSVYKMTGVQEGIEDVDSGVKFLLEFSDSKEDTREGPQCTWIKCCAGCVYA